MEADNMLLTDSPAADTTFDLGSHLENDLGSHFVNDTEFECLMQQHLDMTSQDLMGQQFCLTVWDRLLCWPKTPAGTLALLPCFDELNGIKYDTTQNASRLCHSNGTWDNYTDYTACIDVSLLPLGTSIEITTTLYFVGYSMSLVALSIAVWIFVYFKDLRCLRNTIHTNLMTTYMLADFTWILTITLQVTNISVQNDMTSCVVLIILLHYFHLTNIFWMFVEGLYLYMLVVETFSGENIKLRVYVVIGWGAPIFIVVLWGLVKAFAPVGPETHVTNADFLMRHCPWMTPHHYDWIYQVPAIAVLGINFIFLVMIMWVLITKLRSANTAETQQYRKATKALLVLIPLLGITYILVIAGPTEGIPANIYAYVRAVLLSTQGFTVALFYCFLNTEVQNTVHHHFDRWQTARTVGGSRRYGYSSKDWSPRSRTESIRLYSQPANQYRKRESTVSETTTTTLVGNNGPRASNGSGAGSSAVRATSISPYLTAVV